MNLQQIFEIIELSLALAKNAVAGTPADGAVANAEALEQIAVKVADAYRAETGKPLELGKLVVEEPIK